MPKYKITDPQSGRVVTVSGEKPPTQQDAESIFKQAGLRQGGDESLGINTGMEKMLAPFGLRATRKAGQVEIPGTQGLRKPVQDVTRGVEQSTAAVSGFAPVRETGGAFLRGAVQGETGMTPSFTTKPTTSIGSASQAAGFTAGLLNPKSLVSKAIGTLAKPVEKVAAPVLSKAGEVAAKPVTFIARELEKLGAKAPKQLFDDALEKGINLYDEAASRGYLGSPEKAYEQITGRSFSGKSSVKTTLSAFKTGALAEQEKIIQNAIADAGNPVLLTKKQVEAAVDDVARLADSDAAEQSVREFVNRYMKKRGDKLTASDVRELKSELQEVTTGVSESSAAISKAKKEMASLFANTLKESVPGVEEALAEQQKLIFLRDYMDDLIKNIKRNPQLVTKLHVFAPVAGAARLATFANPAKVGQAIESGVSGFGKASSFAGEQLSEHPGTLVKPFINAVNYSNDETKR